MIKQDTHSSSAPKASKPATQQKLPLKLMGIVIAILVLIIVITIGVQSCNTPQYNWNNLHNDNGRMSYVENGTVTSLAGIDVSSHQGQIDWHAVKNDGIDFAFLRAGRRGYTEGKIYADETFYTNADGAVNAGIPIGVYFFSQAINEDEAREEAHYVLDMISGMKITCPIAYDFENIPESDGRGNSLSPEQVTKNADAFCSVIEQAGYTAIIYGNKYDLKRYDLSKLHHDIWYAEYNVNHPSDTVRFAMWQYTHTGTVAGIHTDVDLNICFDASMIKPIENDQ